MSNNQEILCDKCVHYEVCTHKDTYLRISKSISSIIVELPCSDKAKMSFKEIKDFDFIKDIKVECKYYQNKEVNFYGAKSNSQQSNSGLWYRSTGKCCYRRIIRTYTGYMPYA